MPNDPIDDDIRDVMAEEKSRGRRPMDAAARKLERERLKELREILALEREQDVVGAIRALGHGDDPQEFEKILKTWRALSSSRKR